MVDAQHGKSRRIYELALEVVTLYRPDATAAWHWSQRAKARALTDIIGFGSVLPSRIFDALQAHPDSFALVKAEHELTRRSEKVKPDERPREARDSEQLALHAEMNALYDRMARDPHLADYLELRTGLAIELDDLQAMLSPDTKAGRSCVCIDWIAVGETVRLLVQRPGQTPQIERVPLKLSEIREFVAANLSPHSFRFTLRDDFELLRELDPLIEPLATLTEPEELLILSPTGPIHALPLHTLELDSQPLLARNPVVYCPSLSVLRHCLMRRKTVRGTRTAALFGDPLDDRPGAATLVQELAKSFDTTPLTRHQVTRHTFAQSIADRDIIYFHGHAVHDPTDPLDSHLILADGKFTARDVFGLRNLSAELVTLAACESAANVIETGDEPLGLIPAFLYAGANAVLATLWRVHRASATFMMRHFYGTLTQPDSIIDKAEALRQAMLAARATDEFNTPYHWAPYVIHGDWH